MMELVGNVKNYEWGKIGKASKVAQLAQINDPNFNIDENRPYSELWMGDHVSGPSLIKENGESLSNYLEKNPTSIGGMKSLPFLLKVLSINKALSLQVHPNKAEAERLHAERSDIYKDPNHKPELAIALTPFLALCGFRPLSEIAQVLVKYPEIAKLTVKSENFIKTPTENGLKEIFEDIMRSSQDVLEDSIEGLRKKCKNSDELYEKTFTALDLDFPGDIGCVSMFLLNLVELQPGEAINLEANLPHAYISGDCVEIMACSDNVIRAGLTPKYKDLDTLLKMLDYKSIEKAQVKYQPKTLDDNTRAFIPKVKDFAILEVKTTTSCLIKNRKYGSILLILHGEGVLEAQNGTKIDLAHGKIVFLPTTLGTDLKLVPKNGNFTAYQAMYNDF